MNDQVKETSELETKEVNPQIFKVTVHNVEDTDSTGACPVVQKTEQKNPKRVPNHAVWEALTVTQSSIQTQEVKINQRTNPLTSRSTLLSNTEMFIGVKRRRA